MVVDDRTTREASQLAGERPVNPQLPALHTPANFIEFLEPGELPEHLVSIVLRGEILRPHFLAIFADVAAEARVETGRQDLVRPTGEMHQSVADAELPLAVDLQSASDDVVRLLEERDRLD